jgi:hypothetical protein
MENWSGFLLVPKWTWNFSLVKQVRVASYITVSDINYSSYSKTSCILVVVHNRGFVILARFVFLTFILKVLNAKTNIAIICGFRPKEIHTVLVFV